MSGEPREEMVPGLAEGGSVAWNRTERFGLGRVGVPRDVVPPPHFQPAHELYSKR